MKQSFLIAMDVLLEARRNQVFLLSLSISLLMVFLMAALGQTQEEIRGKLFMELGMGLLWFIHFGLCIFFTVETLYRDREQKTLYFYLVREVSRSQYLFGKFLGILFSVLGSLLITGGAFLLCAFWINGLDARLFYGMFFLLLEMSLCICVLVFFSQVFTKIISIFLFLFLFFFSSFLEYLSVASALPEILRMLLLVVPNFKYYSFLDMIVHARVISHEYLVFICGYTFFMAALFLLLSALQMEKREL